MTDLNTTELSELNDLDNVLSGLDAAPVEEIIGEEIVEEATDTVVEELEALVGDDADTDPPEELSEDILNELQIAGARQSLYENAAAESMPDIAETKDNPGAKIKTKKVRATSKGTSPAAPRTIRDLAAVPSEFFTLRTDLPELTEEDDLTAHKTAVIATRPAQVKIAEKFDNLFMQIAAGKKPSTYVMQAFDLLREKGEFTSADLIAHFKANDLGDGTARSQTGQIMVLFDVTGIAKRTGQKMVAEPTSKIAERITALSAVPATV